MEEKLMEEGFGREEITETLERMIDNLPGFVYRCLNDLEWTMIYVSRQIIDVTGYSAEEVIKNSSISFDSIIHPDHREYLHQKWIEILGNKSVLREEYKIIKKDGSIGWVLEQGRGVFDKVNGELLYLDGYIADITERVKSFDDLTIKNRELEDERRKKEEAYRLKSAFLSNLSHEIRTPLNAILGFTEIVNEDDLLPDIKGYYLDIIRRSGSDLMRTIDDIVISSMIETNQIEPRFSRVNANNMFTLVAEEIKDLFPKNGKVTLSISLFNLSHNLYINTDINLLKDIILRLMSNAVKYTVSGSVEVGTCIGQRLCIYIKDNGIGIEDEYRSKIMESFYRIDNQINSDTRGAGLGLFICKSYVKLLGGEIDFVSQAGKGSTFYIYIPL